nr:hypothetical protein GCM10025699_20110 [Microbacterium flavescens]
MRFREDETYEVLDSRPGLVDPSIDPFGMIWSVPRDELAALRVFLPDGTAVDVTDSWSGATSITAMAVSRDGTRAAAIVSAGAAAPCGWPGSCATPTTRCPSASAIPCSSPNCRAA